MTAITLAQLVDMECPGAKKNRDSESSGAADEPVRMALHRAFYRKRGTVVWFVEQNLECPVVGGACHRSPGNSQLQMADHGEWPQALRVPLALGRQRRTIIGYIRGIRWI